MVNVLLALVTSGLQLGIEYPTATPFLQAHDSKTMMQLQNRRLMLLASLIKPWVISSGFIALTKASHFSLYKVLYLIVMGLPVAPTALACLDELVAETVKKSQPKRTAWDLMDLAVAAI